MIQTIVEGLSQSPVFLFSMQMHWIDPSLDDLNKYKVLVLFRQYEEAELFSAIPKVVGNLNQDGINVILVKLNGGRVVCQSFEVKQIARKYSRLSFTPAYELQLIEQFVCKLTSFYSLFWYLMLRLNLKGQADDLFF